MNFACREVRSTHQILPEPLLFQTAQHTLDLFQGGFEIIGYFLREDIRRGEVGAVFQCLIPEIEQ